MKNSRKMIVFLTVTLFLQISFYLYLDKVLLAPTSAFEAVASTESSAGGKAYYSYSRRYMALTKGNVVEIYSMPGKKLVRTIDTAEQSVSYFKWLEDRDLALLGVHSQSSADQSRVALTQINPLSDGHELSTVITKLPLQSKITDVAYSTATNVIYLQVQVASNPDLFRVYRTDANQELARIYLSTSRVGRIIVLFDQDSLLYENLADDMVYVRHGDGSWQVISPFGNKYRLVAVDEKNTIYLARLNADGLAEAVLKGKLRGQFTVDRTLQTPVDYKQLKANGM